jgi:hypothetical protein
VDGTIKGPQELSCSFSEADATENFSTSDRPGLSKRFSAHIHVESESARGGANFARFNSISIARAQALSIERANTCGEGEQGHPGPEF